MLFLFVVSHGWKILCLLASVLLWLYELPWSVVEKACTDCVYVNVLVDHMVARRRGWFYDHWRCLTESITSRALDSGPVSRLRQLGSKHYQLLVVNDSNFSWRLYFAHIDLLHRLRGGREGNSSNMPTSWFPNIKTLTADRAKPNILPFSQMKSNSLSQLTVYQFPELFEREAHSVRVTS